MSARTVFSVLTPTGRGAVAVVGVSGPGAVQAVEPFFQARNRKSLAEQPISRIVYGNWRSDGEDLIVCRRDADCVEVHCHGGSQAVATITADLARAGCAAIRWQEWLARKVPCPLQVEAQIALAEAGSTRAALLLLDQYHGALARELSEIGDLLKSNGAEGGMRLERLLATAVLGLHLTQPWQVVIAGRPNVGKSSLINALVGYARAIVFDQPGTTRDVVTASTVIDGWPVMLSDTAGLHQAQDELEIAGIELAKGRLACADLAVWVLDASETTYDLANEMREQIAELGLQLPANRLLVLNKIDLATEMAVSEGAIATSAAFGAGIEQLLAAISSALVPKVPSQGEAVIFTERQRAGVDSALAAYRRGDMVGAREAVQRIPEVPRSSTQS